jgi:hypothetical protein
MLTLLAGGSASFAVTVGALHHFPDGMSIRSLAGLWHVVSTVIAPAALIAVLTIAVNLVADGIARSSGRYVSNRGV